MKYFSFVLSALVVAGAQAQVSLGKPVTASSFYDSGSEVFPASNIVDGIGGDTGSPYNWSFWLTAEGQNTGWAIIDLGQQYNISSIALEDTHNRGYFDRGTKDFTVSTSSDGTNYTQVINDSFSYSDWVNLTTRSFGVVSTARYVKVDILDGWGGRSVGLNEVSVFGQATPEPASLAVLGIGAMALIRRRKANRK